VNLQNFTPFPAEITLATDKDGRDSYLVVVKGTFEIGDGEPRPAAEQVPFFYGDQHYGDPETTSIKYESEFAPVKSRADVVVVGDAHARGRGVRRLSVEVRVGRMRKKLIVRGDRRWRFGLGILSRVSWARRFESLPIVYERAFGGADTSHDNPKRHRFERRNPVGTGLVRRLRAKGALPNFYYPGESLRRPGKRIRPAGLGFVGRGWEPRASHAGTYDGAWKKERFPLLPEDFDDEYHQGAPPDQRCELLRGGEPVELRNLTPDGRLSFRLPPLALAIRFRFASRTEESVMYGDTLILEPGLGRFQVVWRASRPVDGKLLALGEVWIGTPSRGRLLAVETRKQYIDRSAR